MKVLRVGKKGTEIMLHTHMINYSLKRLLKKDLLYVMQNGTYISIRKTGKLFLHVRPNMFGVRLADRSPLNIELMVAIFSSMSFKCGLAVSSEGNSST